MSDLWSEFNNVSIDDATLDAAIFSGEGAFRKDDPPMKRKAKTFKRREIIAYDLETTRIQEGTPDVLFITAFSASPACPIRLARTLSGDEEMDGLERLRHCLETDLLTVENHNVRFVAWNGNGYDAFFVSQALLLSEHWTIRPYLTKSRSLRGMRVIHKTLKAKTGGALQFEFLDGMSMTGLDSAKVPLNKFLKMYAPEYQKLDLDLDAVAFDPKNPEHVAYAERDSEGLWHAMQRANEVISDLTGNEFQPTMGRLAMSHFEANMPEGVEVWRATEDCEQVLHTSAKRGGYVWAVRQYNGPVWKYDINQAYAAAMRDCDLPCGSLIHSDHYEPGKCALYRVIMSRAERTKIPFYYKDADSGQAHFTTGFEVDAWILSNEYEHLMRDGWSLEIQDAFIWQDSFNMKVFVDGLEQARFADPEGPSGPRGTMVKMLGNSAYGKTLEKLSGENVVMARECPEGYSQYKPDELANCYFILEEDMTGRSYHRPQIGCFITAHVRMLIRDAALKAPHAFLYADTDCVCFSEPVTHLDVDPRRYGAWKAETEGVDYVIIGKKVYAGADGTKHAKGLRIAELCKADFEKWLSRRIPKQRQIQRNNFLKCVSGQPMFRAQERNGTDVHKSKSVKIKDGEFSPVERARLNAA